MKMITTSSDVAYLGSLQARLEQCGIPAVVQGENTARMITSMLMTQPSLWIYLDDQFEDALALVNDPDHQVAEPIDVDEFYRLNENVSNDTALMNEALVRLAVTAAGWLLAFYILFRLLVWWTGAE